MTTKMTIFEEENQIFHHCCFFGSDWFYVGSLVFPSFFLFDLLFNILIVHHSHLPSENFMECSLKSIVQWLTNTITIELFPVPCLHELTPKPREGENPSALWLGTVFQLHTNLAMTPFQPNPKPFLCIVFHHQVLLQCILPEETPIRGQQGRKDSACKNSSSSTWLQIFLSL